MSVLAAQVPDPPTGLVNDKTVTGYQKIGLTWSAPSFDGGSPVIDYQVWISTGVDDAYILVGQNIYELQSTVTGLSTGTEYWFKVKARNSEGLSELSLPVSITAAYRPLKPEITSIVQNKDEIIVSWSDLKNGGSPVTRIDVKILDSVNFIDVSDFCVQEALEKNRCTVSTQVFSESPFS